MAKEKFHKTQAVRVLNQNRVNFSLHSYKYEEKGGTQTAARELGVEEHLVIKTLVMEDQEKKPFLVLMHGDREVSTKALARTLGVKAVRPSTPEIAHKHTGYVVGGISPFGTRKPLKVLVESSILELPRIFINAGKRGLLAEMSPKDLKNVLHPVPVSVAIPRK
ncbi:MAG: Cys-tRNA(Pro) deacylase [Deltaproteobacteria bacterium]|nr:Cys-tRNA(Pro) deacylase [Deltaproteobacteria bacterium]MBW1919967.1 Cys-tRNA(Pro) deacylase [Deltaproteobacteria bacterium]MBW1934625.1 Cys-tRNA(Pro) deacylase [Deltaproteobacteria bacterium]MBW1977940.1 Cys-tRNA(Pro) deacylase [Deltaproteobacteria bacterium]MBW2299542.1 Cys-tRNA(Pro) deacylase [Deltaproteobacteria bacterium]